MGFAKEYFKKAADSPAPLGATTTRRIRFEEVDPLNIVWHGRYVSFLDDGRVACADKYGLTYQQFIDAKIPAPIVQMHIDYLAPLLFDEIITIETSMHWSDALRFNYEYKISGADGRLAARAYTVQLLTDMAGQILLVVPDWIEDFRNRWRRGKLA